MCQSGLAKFFGVLAQDPAKWWWSGLQSAFFDLFVNKIYIKLLYILLIFAYDSSTRLFSGAHVNILLFKCPYLNVNILVFKLFFKPAKKPLF